MDEQDIRRRILMWGVPIVGVLALIATLRRRDNEAEEVEAEPPTTGPWALPQEVPGTLVAQSQIDQLTDSFGAGIVSIGALVDSLSDAIDGLSPPASSAPPTPTTPPPTTPPPSTTPVAPIKPKPPHYQPPRPPGGPYPKPPAVPTPSKPTPSKPTPVRPSKPKPTKPIYVRPRPIAKPPRKPPVGSPLRPTKPPKPQPRSSK